MTIHFTSGTNGPAKGVELTYQAYHYACQNTQTSMNVSADDRFLSYLPLAHIAERMMIEGNAVFSGARTYFVSSLDNFVTDLKFAKPTAFMSVPRLWKNFQTGIHSKLPPRVLDVLLRTPGISWLMKKLVRKLLGLSSARLTGSGAAAMPVDLLKWYERIGIPISEAWGLTETCGLSTMNYPYDPAKVGTIGNAVPGTEIKLADDGELLIKSKGLFQQYADNPEATENAFDSDGFFRTGDLAHWNQQTSAWQLIGRKNDTFKTSKGKFVNPARIETQLNQNDLIEQSCVVGEGRKQPLALVQLATSERENTPTKDKLKQLLQALNTQLEKHEQLEGIFVSQNSWTPENQMVTPTLKIRRRKISENYENKLPESLTSDIGWLEKI
jgi:long-subunit acyl-CoA synthetase (AMP-forming)